MRAFVPFGPDHVVVLSGLAVGIVVVLVSARRWQGRDDRALRYSIALVLLGNETIAYVAALAHGVVRIPLQLCDLALLATLCALLRPRPLIGTVAYFWGWAGSLQAILTPDLREAFPDYWWAKFFISHCGVVLSVVYLAATGRVNPTHRSVWTLFGLTNLYALTAGAVNWFAGTNFGYLAHKPLQPSLLDAFGPWPYYIVGMELVALASFYLYYAPFILRRSMQRWRTP